MVVNAAAAEDGTCLFHDRIEKRVDKHEEEIGEIKTRLATGDERFKAFEKLEKTIAKANYLTITTLIGIVLTLLTVVFKLKG